MVEAPRPRAIEHYNPRPLILGLCFFWGTAVGFCLFYFSPPKQMITKPTVTEEQPQSVTPRSPSEIRQEGIPVITDVSPVLEPAAAPRPRLETMLLEPPIPVLSTEGGLTGRTAHPIGRQAAQAPTPTRTPRPITTPPPIPELLP